MIIYDPHQQLIIKGSRRAETYEAGGGHWGHVSPKFCNKQTSALIFRNCPLA